MLNESRLFIKGGVPLHDQSKIHVSVNPKKNYVLQDGEHAIIIP